MDLPFSPGVVPARPSPLARFLPPLDEGEVKHALRAFGQEGQRLLDPFGVSPRLVVEAAQAGRAVLVAANNPVTRLVIERTIRPFSPVLLRSAIATLAAAPKDGTRLEPFLLDLYRTRCGRCGSPVSADYFLWDREAGVPHQKAYTCVSCNHVAIEMTDDTDRTLALQWPERGLHYAQALERVAPAGDPHRPHAETALTVYPPRSLYALITLVTKCEQLQLAEPLGEAARALMLSAFDSCNALWGHPEGRSRPRQLSVSPQFRETNVWRALERGLEDWALDDPKVGLTRWPDAPQLEAGSVSLYPGSARGVSQTLKAGQIDALLTVLPRPNQAYWTLSALWAAWLWGREAAAPIKVALRRRRYDWGWHAGALRSATSGVAAVIPPGTEALVFLPEAEPGFVAAAMAALDASGLCLTGRALRLDEGRAILKWTRSDALAKVSDPETVQKEMRLTLETLLQARGEPTPYPVLHAAVWGDLAQKRRITPHWISSEGAPLSALNEVLHGVLDDRRSLVRLDQRTDIETGLFWLAKVTALAAEPLMDRVESLILDALRRHESASLVELDIEICEGLPGLLTPDRRQILAGLTSYAVEDPEAGRWHLREEDNQESRARDCLEIRQRLAEIGARLGFSIHGNDPLEWRDEAGRLIMAFRVRETAAVSGPWLQDATSRDCFVIPGGRAQLIAEKARRDPRIRTWLQRGVRLIKFRHVRRLSEDSKLSRENLMDRLAMDPPEHEDPQLPLL